MDEYSKTNDLCSSLHFYYLIHYVTLALILKILRLHTQCFLVIQPFISLNFMKDLVFVMERHVFCVV